MNRIAKITVLAVALIFGGMILPCPAQTQAKAGLVEIYDGADSSTRTKLFLNSTVNVTNEDKEFVGNVIKEQKASIQRQAEGFANQKCAMNSRTDTVLQGSFTRPNSSQKAYSYELSCGEKDIYGLMIAEADKMVFNRFYSIFHPGLKVLPDINKNGLSELAVIWSTDLTEHFTLTNLEIVECKSGNTFVDLGRTSASLSGIWLGESRFYKVFVKPSANPAFFRETYEPDKDNKWVLIKELEEFKLDKYLFSKQFDLERKLL